MNLARAQATRITLPPHPSRLGGYKSDAHAFLPVGETERERQKEKEKEVCRLRGIPETANGYLEIWSRL